MKNHNLAIGRWGENQAAEYLAAHGHEVISRNVRTPYGEIDIVVRHKDLTVFFEVKTLVTSRDFFPEHNITRRKREHMLAAAEYYASQNAIDHWRIDVLAVEGEPGGEIRITHFENVT
jgi:putative endonuclease